MSIFPSLLAAALIVPIAQVTPAPPTAPLKTIVQVESSTTCALLHRNVAQSVGDVLANDALIYNAGTSAQKLVDEIILDDDDTPAHHAGMMFQQARLVSGGNRIVGNLSDIDKELQDPVLRTSTDPQMIALRSTLETIAQDQNALVNVIFGLGMSEHPTDIRTYGDSVEATVRQAMSRVPRHRMISGDIFLGFQQIAQEKIAATHSIEQSAATQITTIAASCR